MLRFRGSGARGYKGVGVKCRAGRVLFVQALIV